MVSTKKTGKPVFKRRNHQLVLAVLAALPALAGAAPAGDSLADLPLGSFVDAISLEQLSNMVVTDTKIAQSPDSVTQKILVLHSQDMERQPDNHRNLADLLNYTSGQFVNVLSRNDANWGSYAGLGPKYNSYLLDGLPIDSFVDAMSLDTMAIERVEVHKGPASVLYANYLTMDFAGNEAPLAGTTNFVLKSRIDKPLTRFSVGAGSWGAYAARAYTQGRSGNLSYVAGLSGESADYTQYGAPNSWLQTVNSPDYDKTKLFANLTYELGRPDHTLSLFAHQSRQDGDMGRPNRDFRHRYDTLNFTYNNRFAEAWHLQFKAGERRYDRLFGNDNWPANLSLTSHDNTRQTIRPLDLTLSYLHGGNSLLTVGMDTQSVHYQTDSRSVGGVTTRENDAQARSTGYFLQEKVQWRDWVFRAGVRHNTIHHDYALLGGNTPATGNIFWSRNLWSLGVRYNAAADFAVYANAGSSFMAPTAKQIGGTVSAPTAGGHLPNPALRPESGIGRDIGFDWKITRTFDAGMRVFLNTLSDAIVDNAVGATQAISQNAGSTRSSGVEIDLRYTPSADLSGFANLTHTRTRVENANNPGQDGTEIPFVPDLVANLGLTARLPGNLTLSPYFHWVGQYYDSASRSGRQVFGNYGEVNLRLRHTWRPGLDVVVDLNNIGNRRYDMPWGFLAPGINGFVGVNFTL